MLSLLPPSEDAAHCTSGYYYYCYNYYYLFFIFLHYFFILVCLAFFGTSSKLFDVLPTQPPVISVSTSSADTCASLPDRPAEIKMPEIESTLETGKDSVTNCTSSIDTLSLSNEKSVETFAAPKIASVLTESFQPLPAQLLKKYRNISVDLSPRLLFSRGDMVSLLVISNFFFFFYIYSVFR